MDLSRNFIQLSEMILTNLTVTSKAITKYSRELDGEKILKKLNLADQVSAIYTLWKLLCAHWIATTSAYLNFFLIHKFMQCLRGE